MIRVALIGAGEHSTQLHAPALQHFQRQYPGRITVAVCDQDAYRMQDARDRFGFEQGYTDAGELQRRFRPDAAMLIVPIAVTYPMVQQFLPDGIPLLIEKPLGENIAQARSLTKLVTASGVPAMVSLNRRFDPGFKLARTWLADQAPLRVVQGSLLRVRRSEHFFVWGTGIHLLDLICSVTGPLHLASSSAHDVRGTASNIWRLGRLESDSGPVVSVAIMPACGHMEEWVRFSGENFCLDLWTGTSHPWRVRAHLDGSCVLNEMSPPEQPEYLRGGTWDETQLFLDAVLEGTALPGPTVVDALVSSEVVAAIEENQP